MGIYILLILPSLLLGLWAQARVKRNMGKYSKVANIRGLTGEQTARQILDSQGLYDVPVEESRFRSRSPEAGCRITTIRVSAPCA